MLMTAAAMLAGMSLYEWASTHTLPGLSAWQSRVVTILFSSVLATTASYFVLRRLERAKTAVQRTAARHWALTENTLDIITVIGADGVIRYENPAVERIFGYAPAELVGRSVYDFVHPDEELEVRAEFGAVLAETAATRDLVFRFRCRDDTWRVLEAKCRNLLHAPAIRGVVVNSRDITERALADRALRASESALREAKEQADKANRAKSEFLARTSHELCTPLNAILGFGQVLELGPLGKAERESVEEILKAGRHLLALIDQVLAISGIDSAGEPLRMVEARAAELLATALETIRPLAAERRIALRWPGKDSASEWIVVADRERVGQVLVQLLANAVKYNREGGVVTVGCEEWSEAWLRFTVRDTGPGLSAEQMARLFTPFDRLGAERAGVRGAGLGLALSESLVHAMGGQIGVESTVGDGSLFWVHLPRAVIL